MQAEITKPVDGPYRDSKHGGVTSRCDGSRRQTRFRWCVRATVGERATDWRADGVGVVGESCGDATTEQLPKASKEQGREIRAEVTTLRHGMSAAGVSQMSAERSPAIHTPAKRSPAGEDRGPSSRRQAGTDSNTEPRRCALRTRHAPKVASAR